MAKVTPEYNLAVLHPEIAKQWHPTKNDGVEAKDVAPGSGKRWWKCDKGPDHEWEASCSTLVANYVKGKGKSKGCPFCRGFRVSVTNRLANKPEVAKQWHPTKNGDLTPNDVTSTTSKKYWWLCPKSKDHEWEAAPYERTEHSKTGCPFCSGYKVAESNCLATVYPDLAAQWDYSKNGNHTPETIYAKSNTKFCWKCDKGPDHEWRASPSGRHQAGGVISGCPCCANKKLSVTNSLQTVRPDLVAEWHPTKNKKQPHEIIAGSGQKFWWKCSKGPDHEWEAIVAARTGRGDGCPCCAGLKVSITNCLETVEPGVVGNWHQTKNDPTTPKDIIAHTKKKYWWKCSEGPDHEWQQSPGVVIKNYQRSGKNGCSFCAGKRVSVTNSLATKFPEVAANWHPEKNRDKTPADVIAHSNKKVWWKCLVEPVHEWRASPDAVARSKRAGATGCPYCSSRRVSATNNLEAKHPEIAKLWHPEKNRNKTPADVLSHSNKKAWWKCPEGLDHEWRAPPDQVIRNTEKWGSNGCPCCSNYRLSVTNNLAVKYPEIAKLWHPENNKNLTPATVIAGSNVKRWWVCPEGPDHEWQASVQRLITALVEFGTNGCPYCRGLKVSVTNSLQNIHPDIAEYWHPTKNDVLTPSDVTWGTSRKVWWKCPVADDHEWTAPPIRIVSNNRKSGKYGCPYCSAKKVSVTNSLVLHYPEIAAEWHPEKNKSLDINKVVYGSGRKVWWKCSHNSRHKWRARVAERTVYGYGCAECSGVFRSMRHVSVIELYLAFELSHFFDTNPDDRRIRILSKTREADIKIPGLKLVVEFDGAYWHKGKVEQDREKTELFKNNGWEVIRVREMPLDPITETDVVVPQLGRRVKPIADEVLQQIKKVCGIKIPGLGTYLKRDRPINKRAADEYIAALVRDEQQSTLIE